MAVRGMLAGVVAMLVLSVAAGDGDRALGRQLYVGEVPMPGTISGHVRSLPALATRCTNCHSRASVVRSAGLPAAGVPVGASAPASFAPLLTRDRLLGAVARRGGPPSRYDQAAFCHLLRTGIDPAIMLVARQMPRYAIDDAQCAALWSYLIDGGDAR